MPRDRSAIWLPTSVRSRSRIDTALYRIMKVSAASATIADSVPLIPIIEYSASPSDAATSTMQMAMKIVEIRII